MGLCAVLTNPRGSEEYLSDSRTRYWTEFTRVWGWVCLVCSASHGWPHHPMGEVPELLINPLCPVLISAFCAFFLSFSTILWIIVLCENYLTIIIIVIWTPIMSVCSTYADMSHHHHHHHLNFNYVCLFQICWHVTHAKRRSGCGRIILWKLSPPAAPAPQPEVFCVFCGGGDVCEWFSF